MQTNNNDVLSHHGVKGQKWGVRNYQYKDGSLTPKGKKRLGIGTVGDKLNKARKATAKKVSELHKKRVVKKELKKAEKKALKELDRQKRKSTSEMTDEELSKAINRARMEDQYNALRPEPVSKGRAFIKTLGNDVVKPALISSGKRALEQYLNKAVDNALKDKIDPNSVEGLKKTAEKLRAKEEVDMLKKYGVSSWKDVRTKQQAEAYEEGQKRDKAAADKAAADKADQIKQERAATREKLKKSTVTAEYERNKRETEKLIEQNRNIDVTKLIEDFQNSKTDMDRINEWNRIHASITEESKAQVRKRKK